MSSSGDGYNEEQADYEASYGDYNLANQEYEDAPGNVEDINNRVGNSECPGNEEQNDLNYDQEHQRDIDDSPSQEKYESHEETSNAIDNRSAPLAFSSASKLDDDERKIFVGGLHWETTVNDLRDYFSKFGKIVDATLKTDPATGRSRGFGFVLFDSISPVDKVCCEKSHILQGKNIDPKRAMSRASSTKDPVKKIFVGGVSPDMPESEIRNYFGKYGKIEEVELPFDRLKNQRRAYVFITFESEKVAEDACSSAKQKLGEREVDVRRATPRAENDAARAGFKGYDYSNYYNYGYGYPGYSIPGYDYSSYYGQDWSQYSQYAQYGYPASGAYAGYDYSNWYAQQDQSSQSSGKTKRGSSTAPYHPYAR